MRGDVSVFGAVLQDSHGGFPSAARTFDLVRQNGPIRYVLLNGGFSLRRAQAPLKGLGIGFAELFREVFDDFGFAFRLQLRQTEILPDVLHPIRQGPAL